MGAISYNWNKDAAWSYLHEFIRIVNMNSTECNELGCTDHDSILLRTWNRAYIRQTRFQIHQYLVYRQKKMKKKTRKAA